MKLKDLTETKRPRVKRAQHAIADQRRAIYHIITKSLKAAKWKFETKKYYDAYNPIALKDVRFTLTKIPPKAADPGDDWEDVFGKSPIIHIKFDRTAVEIGANRWDPSYWYNNKKFSYHRHKDIHNWIMDVLYKLQD